MKKGSKIKLLGLALAGICAVASSEAIAGDVVVKTDGGLKVYDSEGDYWFKLNGRLHIDQVFFNGSETDRTGYPSGSNLRRARIAVKGGFEREWAYKLQLDFAEGSNQLNIAEAFLAFTGYANSTLAIGQFAQPQGMENWSSSNWFTFMEAALPTSALAPGNGLGIYGDWHGDAVAVMGTIMHPADEVSAGTGAPGGIGSSDEIGYTGRIIFAPVHNEETVWHFGGSYHHEDFHDKHNTLTIATMPEARGRGTTTTLLTTGTLTNVANNLDTWGVEAAGMWGPFSLQAEYLDTEVSRDSSDGGDLDFDGYYVQAAYTLTGENRSYDFPSGTFGPIHPKAPCGAWEVAARYSSVSLSDKDIVGGTEHNFTVGLNWYVNENLRFMANYIFANLPNDVDLDIIGFRAQVVW